MNQVRGSYFSGHVFRDSRRSDPYMESRRSDPYTGDELYDSIFGSYKIKDVTQTIGVTNLSHVGVILTCYIWVKNV